MTVQELIDALSEMPPDGQVVIRMGKSRSLWNLGAMFRAKRLSSRGNASVDGAMAFLGESVGLGEQDVVVLERGSVPRSDRL